MSHPNAVALHKPRMDDRPLQDMTLAIWGCPAVLVAHDLKLFPLLAEQPCTLPEICEALHLVRRPAQALLTVCTSLGLVQLQKSHYALTPLAEVDRIFKRYFVAPLPVAALWKPATGAAGAAARAAGGGVAGAAPNALDRRKWYSFKRVLLWNSSEKAQADQGVAGCSAVWGPGPN